MNKNYITIISTILVFSLISCSHYIVNEAGYIRPPKKHKFTYKKNGANLNNINIIDTTSIYYLSNSNYYRNSDKYKNRDEYIRIYADGKFKIHGTKEFPKIEDINDINKGIVGYYLLKG